MTEGMKTVKRRLWKIRLLWEDVDFPLDGDPPYSGFREDFAFLEEVAEGKAGDARDRFFANHTLSEYYVARSEYGRAIEYLRTALPDAKSHWQAAICHRDIFAYLHALGDGGLGDEQLDHYESFALECFLGLQGGESQAIGLVLEEESLAEKLGDHALLAGAACAWSLSPENWNVVDQVEAMERYHQELRAFREEDPQLLSSPWGRRREEFLARLSERESRENPNNIRQRQLYLSLRAVAEKQMKAEPEGYACSPMWGDVSEEERKTADELKREAERYREKYSAPGAGVLSVPMEGLEEYIALARRYIRRLQEGNALVLRAVAEEPELFTDMWDYLIPTAACLLWSAHPANRDIAERREAGERAKHWLDVFFGVMVGPLGKPYLFEKWKKRGLSEYGERRKEWIGLLKDTLRKLS